MNLRLSALLLSVAAGHVLRAADEVPETHSHMKDVLKARLAEDAKKVPPASGPKPAAPAQPGAPTAAAADSTTAPASAKTDATPPSPGTTAATPAPGTKAAPAKTAQQPATVMPKVEVRKGRITELDQKLAEQDQAIARERKNLKTSEVDTALNDSKVAKPMAIFGGESSQFRKRVASERVELMEAEKDLIEAIARAKTKEEKQELQKQLNELKAVRRDLEKSLR